MGKKFLFRWKLNKSLVGYVSFFLLVGLCLSVMSVAAWGFSFVLHSKGVWSASCSAGYLTSHNFDKSAMKNTYAFKGQCVQNVGESATNTWYNANASWNVMNKTAEEYLSVTFINGTLAGSVLYTCPDDPWINNVNCTITGKAGDIFNYFQPGDNPITSNFISSTQKQALKTEWANKPAVLTTPQAPLIISPSPNQAFWSPITLQIKVVHNPNYGVGFEFQWCPFNKPNTPPGFFITKNLTPVNLKTNAGGTTADLTINEVGKWRLRAQSNFPNASWSEWREFTVDTFKLTPGLPPSFKPVK